jgi:DNA (cytosine-5)-methyltransferase 1
VYVCLFGFAKRNARKILDRIDAVGNPNYRSNTLCGVYEIGVSPIAGGLTLLPADRRTRRLKLSEMNNLSVHQPSPDCTAEQCVQRTRHPLPLPTDGASDSAYPLWTGERKQGESRPMLLDLFCGAGGASMGYYEAGFQVVGVDINPMPRYPFEFHQGDALEFLAAHGHEFSAIHASPPCQDYIPTIPRKHGTAHFLPDVRKLLIKIGKPWIIENIPGAPMRADFRLCGCMFHLPRLRRQRLFETSWNGFALLPPCYHPEHPISVTGHGIPSSNFYREKLTGPEFGILVRKAMGIDWMTRDELSQAIPPAYTNFIGGLLLANTALFSPASQGVAGR